ncbi:MAG: Uma2 family endonuclease [Pyrinomonadaceae bacterium]|nr:Uma2 family endonuclease [Pyrinomonadaceae bacterium]
MATVARSKSKSQAQSVVIENVSWQSYEKVLSAFVDSHAAHFYYNNGALEIMVLSLEHEIIKEIIGTIIDEISLVVDKDFVAAGSTTFRRKKKEKGFEPDKCYYFGEKIALIRGKKRINLAVDPPPDLVIEIDITHSSMNRHEIFAALGVREVWRHDGEKLQILRLDDEKYESVDESVLLPGLKGDDISKLVKIGQRESRIEFIKKVREYGANIDKRG